MDSVDPSQYRQVLNRDDDDTAGPSGQIDGSLEERYLHKLEVSGQVCDFVWNGRSTKGLPFHQMVLEGRLWICILIDYYYHSPGDYDRVLMSLHKDLSVIGTRWISEGKYNGNKQLYSGTAMHLAATRGGPDLLKLLLAHRAQLDEKVTRGGVDNYDVLHAAVFNEGRGGNTETVQFILEQDDISLTQNADGRYPIHIAFLTGSIEVVWLLRNYRQDHGLPDLEAEEHTNGRETPSPLELGITSGNLTEDRLAEVALVNAYTMFIFMKVDPHCIQKWLERLEHLECLDKEEREKGLKSEASEPLIRREELVPYISVEKLAEVIREAPQAADALLRFMTHRPEVVSPWHPLPQRVSFAPETMSARLFQMLNPCSYRIIFEESEPSWTFDIKEWQFPQWHHKLRNVKAGRPIKDVDFKVCFIPNLSQALIFEALMDHDDGEALQALFTNQTVVALISHVWWSEAWRVDLAHTVFNTWGLVLLVIDQLVLFRRDEALSHHDIDQRRYLMAPEFIVAKATLQLVVEFFTFLLFWRMGRAKSFFTLWECFRITRQLLSCVLLRDTALFRPARAVIIIIYWGLIARLTYFSESIAQAMMPIMNIVEGLLPSLVFVLIGFCAVAHAFMMLRSGEMDAMSCVVQVFDTLLTGDIFTGGVLSDHGPLPSGHHTPVEIMLTVGSVVLFSVFFLNLFTGVMCQLYSQAAESSLVSHRLRLTRNCLHHLLWSGVTRRFRLGKYAAGLLILIGAVPSLAIQVRGYSAAKAPDNRSAIYLVGIMLMYVGAHLWKTEDEKVHHSNAVPVARARDGFQPLELHHQYLWIIEAVNRKVVKLPSLESAPRTPSITRDNVSRTMSKMTQMRSATNKDFRDHASTL